MSRFRSLTINILVILASRQTYLIFRPSDHEHFSTRFTMNFTLTTINVLRFVHVKLFLLYELIQRDLSIRSVNFELSGLTSSPDEKLT